MENAFAPGDKIIVDCVDNKLTFNKAVPLPSGIETVKTEPTTKSSDSTSDRSVENPVAKADEKSEVVSFET